MSVDERARHRLYNRVVEVLGEEEAVTLMAHLPPGGWPNLATKQDVLQLQTRMDELEQRLLGRMSNREEHLDGRISELEHRLKAHTLRVVLTTNVATVAVVVAIAFTATGLR